jgi:hypothetical protein
VLNSFSYSIGILTLVGELAGDAFQRRAPKLGVMALLVLLICAVPGVIIDAIFASLTVAAASHARLKFWQEPELREMVG